MSNVYAEARIKSFESFRQLGMAATYVGLNDKGEVVANFLSPEQLHQLIQLYDSIKEIPPEYSIYDADGNKLTT